MLSETRGEKETKDMVGGKLNGVKGKTFFNLNSLAMCKETAKRNGENIEGGGEGEGEGQREGEGEKERFMGK